MERKRRVRINKSIEELKTIVLQAMNKDVSNNYFSENQKQIMPSHYHQISMLGINLYQERHFTMYQFYLIQKKQ